MYLSTFWVLIELKYFRKLVLSTYTKSKAFYRINFYGFFKILADCLFFKRFFIDLLLDSE